MQTEEATVRMRKISDMRDVEDRHIAADDLMCRILCEQGYIDLVRIFKNIRKYYV